ncbi:hypothetical protein [Sulfobacillus thermosulfidooxidans]|uniref:hypothetical protein n=1 Tax=Sulfobacillus thermosulfidooxidans TaxID=28034 RepID=UPI0006B5BAB5|nr:hypothetical protein [Sulfobacillus thermosulfidooxidans]
MKQSLGYPTDAEVPVGEEEETLDFDTLNEVPTSIARFYHDGPGLDLLTPPNTHLVGRKNEGVGAQKALGPST